MTRSLLLLLVLNMSLVEQGLTQYTLVDDYSYQNFFSNFNLITSSDPTLGFVQYQSLDSAISNQYIGYLNESVYLGVDHTNKTPNGRPSLRLEGKKAYNQGLLIADITHMPDSTCGNWPALWMFSDPWPEMGEIDIIEGVNQQSVNAMTLHTSAGCVVENATVSPEDQADTNGQLAFSGQMTTLNCDVDAAGQAQNVGCSIQAPKTTPSASVTSTENLPASPILPTYGTNFNLVGGGVYAMEWTTNSISIWFFPRTRAIPNDITSNAPNPSHWGTPLANFAGRECDFQTHFKDLRIVIDTTFCGAWAGKAWQSGGCAASTSSPTCEAYVSDNPAAFAEAYWEISGLKWFQNPAAKAKRDSNHAQKTPHQKGRLYRWWLQN